jgi:hypothetical protein
VETNGLNRKIVRIDNNLFISNSFLHCRTSEIEPAAQLNRSSRVSVLTSRSKRRYLMLRIGIYVRGVQDTATGDVWLLL